ncbi:hypothetical protein FRACYDRAFT_234902 [Fragilariopsis cylindrus CCMP1102]|uniref:Uncharacterized protein n=1 Tax=Fragilariopsis cylindrus CCMP1102 TaxID=635003 RepID=A0A1E7FT54_9STRA|nr:hypothetical protein FRACYDRAFT_234902 [Fragilariopsis cylindrus CCMP1102]|eukprot:OEU21275.1 hypothetical protein FRACYDRAFT_234902 [Fragilariopsis cylindrus CCMP1102]
MAILFRLSASDSSPEKGCIINTLSPPVWLLTPLLNPSMLRKVPDQPGSGWRHGNSLRFEFLRSPSGLNLLTLGHQNLRAHFWWCGSGSSISADLGSTLSTTGLRFNFVPQVILRGMYGEACLGSQNGQLELIFSNSVIFFYIQEDYT